MAFEMRPTISFRIYSPDIDAALAGLRKLGKAQMRALSRTMQEGMFTILKDANTRPPMVPVDTGNLKSTGRVHPIKITNDTMIDIELTYGGVGFSKEVDYAVVVHENLGPGAPNKQYTRPGSGPKFVSTHVDARKSEFTRNMEKALETGVIQSFAHSLAF